MTANPEPRRIVLTALFVLWLSVQSIIIAMSPAWGFVLPHEHITRGVLSERAWQEHLREHRLGIGQFFEARCDLPATGGTKDVVVSIPASAAAFSLFSVIAADVDVAPIEMHVIDETQTRLLPASFHALEITFAPLEPPPNL
jgi:hypothetical protein